MKRRVYIAINLPENLKEEIVAVQKKLKKFDWPVRWTTADNIHLTLRFLGSITDQKIEQAKSIVEQAVNKNKSFFLQIDNFIAFPNLKMPRVICLNIEENNKLLNLQADIAGPIEEQGIGESERHPFSGHITIGRVKPISANYRALTQIKFSSQFEVKSVEIMESVLKSEGPVYSVVESYELMRDE